MACPLFESQAIAAIAIPQAHHSRSRGRHEAQVIQYPLEIAKNGRRVLAQLVRTNGGPLIDGMLWHLLAFECRTAQQYLGHSGVGESYGPRLPHVNATQLRPAHPEKIEDLWRRQLRPLESSRM